MSDPKSLLQDLLGFLGELHEGAREMLGDDFVRNSIVQDLGGKPSAGTSAPRFPPAGLPSVKAYRDAAEPGLEALLSAIHDIRAYQTAMRAFVESLDLGPDASVDEAYRLLLDILGWNLIRLKKPQLFFVMQALSLVEELTSAYGAEFNGPVAIPLALDRVLRTILDPRGWFDQSNFASERGVTRVSDRIALGGLAGVKILGLTNLVPADEVFYGWDVVPDVATPSAGDLTLARTFTGKFVTRNRDKPPGDADFERNLLATLALLPRAQGGPGLFASLGGGISVDAELARPWHFSAQMQSAGAVSVLFSKKRKFEINAPDEGSDFHATLAFEARPDPAARKALDLSLGTNLGLSVELLRFEGTLSKQGAQLRTQAVGGVLSIGPEILGGFIGKLLPKDGLRLDFDIGVGVASDRGEFIEGRVRSFGTPGTPKPGTTPTAPGGAMTPPPLPPLPRTESSGPGFSLRIPLGKSLGPLSIHDLQLRIGLEGPEDDRTYTLDAAASLSTKLGPIVARVDRAGLRFGVRFPKPPEEPNLGWFDLDVGALLPNGVGLAIDAKGIVTGGGFLFYDKLQELYAGVMQLTLRERLTVSAFGLVATKMPDGRQGFSLIVFITAEGFQPIPIGMAATLRGIGGMIAVNRTFNEEAMREGLKNKTLATLLFPKDPIRNAPEIIRNLVTCFPAEEGGFLVGVLMKIAWFSPPLVFLDIAIMVELGNRMRVIALGMISALLPTRENDLVRLNLDAMGVINMGRLDVAIDAVIVDSRLAHKFVLTGNAALRASALQRSFILSVGGFNPRFLPPAGLPKLARITIALASGNNPRLTCEAYFAITSNTIQFGARAQLYAAAFGFSIEGEVGFDVLVQLLPFHLVADFKASVQLKRGSRSLFKLSVEGLLEGPRPLRIAGKASFEIFWCDFTIRFDKTLVSGDKPPLPPAVDALAELTRALHSPESWSTELAANRQHGVTLRKLAPGTALVLDPLGNLVVKQRVVPLNTSRDIDVFGGAPIAGARRFELKASLGALGQDAHPVRDAFAPAQFFAMTDDEKLASPSFEDMEAGVVFGTDAVQIDDRASIFAPLDYETITIDKEGNLIEAEEEAASRYTLTAERLFEQVRFSAVAMAPLRKTGLARFRSPGAAVAVAMRTERYAIASVEDGAVAPATKTGTWIETRATLKQLNGAAAAAPRWQLVPAREMAEI